MFLRLKASWDTRTGSRTNRLPNLLRKLLREAESVCNISAEYRIFPVGRFIDAEKSIALNGFEFSM